MCSTTPRFSYKVLETVICTCTTGSRTRPWYRGEPDVRAQWVPGWVYRVGIPGGTWEGYTGTQPCCSGRGVPSEAGPGRPCRGLEWVGYSPGARTEAVGGYIPTLRARSGSVSPPWDIPLDCRLLAKGARFHLIFYKVSQNREVSPKSVEKACHSPCLPKRVRKVAS